MLPQTAEAKFSYARSVYYRAADVQAVQIGLCRCVTTFAAMLIYVPCAQVKVWLTE